MKTLRIAVLQLLVVTSLIGATADATAASFTYQALNTDGTSNVPVPSAMNSSGTVVGAIGSASGGFVWSDGVLQVVSGTSWFFAVNDDGVAVGLYYDKRGEYPSYDTTTGKLTYVPLKFGGGSPDVFAFGINSSGRVVGEVESRKKAVGFVSVNGEVQKLVPPHEKGSDLVSINSSGAILGNCVGCMPNETAFVYYNKKFTTIAVPGASRTTGAFITDDGVVGGSFTSGGSATQGFVYEHGKYTTYNPPGSTSVSVTGVGSEGQVVGNFVDSSNNTHGFVGVKNKMYQLDVPNSTYTTINGIGVSGSIFGNYDNSNGAFGYIGTCAGNKVCTK